MITDLKTGAIIKIDIPDIVEGLSWSPDGRHLAFSVASCNEQGAVKSSSVYIWDALKNEKHVLFTSEDMVLRPESWIDNSTLRFTGEKIVDLNMLYTIYVYNIEQQSLVFSGTATPSP